MKKSFAFLAILLFAGTSLFAQKYLTRTGQISFLSEAPVENIEAHHNQVTSILDSEKGEIVFSLLMKGFNFEKELMQEHFNEKYVESDKFPKATFKGHITNMEAVDLKKDGTYKVQVEGELTIHGVSKSVSVPGTIKVEGGKLIADATFPIAVADYEIEVPSVVRDNIAKVVEIAVSMNYEPYQKTGSK